MLIDHLLASKLSYVKNEATYFVITDVFLNPRLTVGLGFLVNDLCLQLLIGYSRRMEVSQRDKYFNDSVNNVTYRLNGHRVTFLAWNVHVELQPPMIPLFGYKNEGLFIW